MPAISSTKTLSNEYFWLFAALFGLRYIRVISNIFGNIIYRPTILARSPKYNATNVTVMIPTMGLNSDLLQGVVNSILVHPIAKLIVVTNGPNFELETETFTETIPDSRIQLLHCDFQGRRQKTAVAIPYIQTPLVVLQDNKTTWPTSTSFLPLMLAPFEDPKMGAVMPLIEARHHHHRFPIEAFYNFLGMTYLVRRNHEYRACNAIDSGLSTVPGRFGLFRTSIYADERFQYEYLNEYCWLPFFGRRGPLDADDDKFHTRWLIEHGWKMKIQSFAETTMITENGESRRFASQMMRWTRTTWRSNPRELMHGKVWRRYPFTSITLLLWMVRMSLFHEVLLFWLLYKIHESVGNMRYFPGCAATLAFWIVALKFNKVSHHFSNYPKDLVWFIPYVLFGWYCSFVKIWAMVTWYKIEWEVAELTTVLEQAEFEEVSGDTKEVAPGVIRL